VGGNGDIVVAESWGCTSAAACIGDDGGDETISDESANSGGLGGSIISSGASGEEAMTEAGVIELSGCANDREKHWWESWSWIHVG
jgi:hypothetical protein